MCNVHTLELSFTQALVFPLVEIHPRARISDFEEMPSVLVIVQLNMDGPCFDLQAAQYERNEQRQGYRSSPTAAAAPIISLKD